jgi:transcriptional regulator with XRE-family HTH domain
MRLTKDAGRKLWEARERLGLSRAEVEQRTAANHFKVPEGTIFNIEKGVSKAPYPRNVFALADVYGLDANELFEQEVPA